MIAQQAAGVGARRSAPAPLAIGQTGQTPMRGVPHRLEISLRAPSACLHQE